jgi:hypothetical protein
MKNKIILSVTYAQNKCSADYTEIEIKKFWKQFSPIQL